MAAMYILLLEWVYDVTACSLSATVRKSPDKYIVLQCLMLCLEEEVVGKVGLCCVQVNFVVFVYGQ
jgi:hypothetical protein